MFRFREVVGEEGMLSERWAGEGRGGLLRALHRSLRPPLVGEGMMDVLRLDSLTYTIFILKRSLYPPYIDYIITFSKFP